MADFIIAKPGMRPTTAMKRIIPKIADSQLRRLQTKWKNQKEEQLTMPVSSCATRTVSLRSSSTPMIRAASPDDVVTDLAHRNGMRNR